MLQTLTLRNYKVFRDQTVVLRPLTLFTGLNSTGKTSAMQALLLLRQSYERLQGDVSEMRLVLNGEYTQLGNASDVLNENATFDQHTIDFVLTSEIGSGEWRFRYDEGDLLMPSGDHRVEAGLLSTALFTENHFVYLCAERLGPRVSFEMSYDRVSRGLLGIHGEYAAHYLFMHQNKPVLAQMCHDEAEGQSLGLNVERWLGEISPGTRLTLNAYKDIDRMEMRFGYLNGRPQRATNVGFGLTYTLPVLVALLAAGSGDLVMLENPEAHLHPRGQARLGELLARAADAGVQVIVETHSDHILNGIRIAVRNGLVEHDAVSLNYFQRASVPSEAGNVVEVLRPQLDKYGKFDFRPEGFFDEFDRSLDELL